MSIALSINVPELKLSQTELENYQIISDVGTGGWGKVYLAFRRSDSQIVALKFFGYTNRIPELSAINHEVGLMMSLIGVPGVVQIESLFYDTPNGFLKDKFYLEPFPVIVMEMLSGGDILRRLINRVLKDQIPTELDISHLFKGVVLALQSIHEKAYLHRDLKYNNIILVSDRDDSSVKIIDFGSMIKLPEGDGSCVREELVGTPGFYAPESISRSEYSFKTDIWQIGCILYCLLCGHFPFSYLSERKQEIVSGRFRHSEEWNSLSPSAKDLISWMLQVDPLRRLSLEQILSHPWIRCEEGSISAEPMGQKYVTRLRKLTESERVYHELKDEDGFISKEKILQALNLIISSGESTETAADVPSHSPCPDLQPHIPHSPSEQLAETQEVKVEAEQQRRNQEYDEETLEELLTQVTNRSNDPMNHETFVHFFILSTLTLVKKRRRTEEDHHQQEQEGS